MVNEVRQRCNFNGMFGNFFFRSDNTLLLDASRVELEDIKGEKLNDFLERVGSCSRFIAPVLVVASFFLQDLRHSRAHQI